MDPMDGKSEIKLNNSAAFSNSELDVEIKRDCSFDDNNEAINEFKTVLTEELLIKDEVGVTNIDEKPIITISNVTVNLSEPPIDVKYIKEEVDEIIQFEELDSNNVELKSEPLVKVEPQNEDKPFQCIFCKTRFIDKLDLEQHFDKRARCIKPVCPKCKHKFDTKLRLTNHMKECTKCKICQKPFAGSLSQHMKRHTNIKKLIDCDICQKEYKGKFNVNRLMEIHQSHTLKSNDGILLKCEICQKAYTSQYGMKQHLKSHTEEYECNICKIRFPSIWMIKSHITCHSENKPIIFNQNRKEQCKICQKSFAGKAKLKRHAAIHDDKRPFFECNVCKKKYLNLIEHMKLHNSTREIFECNVCKRTFYQKKSLKLHIRIYHTQEKNFHFHKNDLKLF